MTKKSLEQAEKMGYMVTSSRRIIDIDTSKLLKKGQISSREWKQFRKFLWKVALVGFSIGLVGFAIVDFSLRIK